VPKNEPASKIAAATPVEEAAPPPVTFPHNNAHWPSVDLPEEITGIDNFFGEIMLPKQTKNKEDCNGTDEDMLLGKPKSSKRKGKSKVSGQPGDIFSAPAPKSKIQIDYESLRRWSVQYSF